MPLETATYIHDLVASNPAATDGLSQGDDHLRLIKSVLQANFPNFTSAALNSSNTALDAAVNVLTGASGAAAFPAGTVGAPSISFTGDPDSGWYKPAEDQWNLSLNGIEVVNLAPTGMAVLAGIAAQSFTSTGQISASGAYTGGTGQLCPVGAILMYQGSSPPTGWAWCNGGTVASASNPGLNSIYGNTGGNITLPDWRCAVPVGLDNMGGGGTTGRIAASGVNASIASMNAAVGESTHTLSTGECPTGLHTLNFNDPHHSHGMSGYADWFGGSTGFVAGGAGLAYGTGGGPGTDSASTGITCTLTDHGGNGAHNNVQLGLTVGFIIKLG